VLLLLLLHYYYYYELAGAEVFDDLCRRSQLVHRALTEPSNLAGAEVFDDLCRRSGPQAKKSLILKKQKKKASLR